MAGISSKAISGIENKKKYNGYELNTDLDINLYESFYRLHDPQIGRFWQVDPKPTDFESTYTAMGNNPILNLDILGDDLEGVNKKSARRERRIIRNTFRGREGKEMRKLVKLDKGGLAFKKIDESKFKNAADKLKSDESKALANGYKKVINSEKTAFVSIIWDNEKTKITNEKVGDQFKESLLPSFWGSQINEGFGGGITSNPNSNGNVLVIMSFSPTSNIDYTDFSGNNLMRPSSSGETSAHEIAGETLATFLNLPKNRSGAPVAINVSNLYLKSINAGYVRLDNQSGGHGGPFKIEDATSIPGHLKH